MRKLTVADYPLAETLGGEIRGKRGVAITDITLEAVLDGKITMDDLRITPKALQDQAQIANAAQRPTLALNFGRAAELVDVPQHFVLSTYELLRPGRAKSKQELLERAEIYRSQYAAPGIADFIAEAAEIYDRRGLFTYRF